jgi:hypothetical protein
MGYLIKVIKINDFDNNDLKNLKETITKNSL